MDYFWGVVVVVLVVVLVRLLNRDRRLMVATGRCEWCTAYIYQEDREEQFQTTGGQVICPGCWEYTVVDEDVVNIKLERTLLEERREGEKRQI